MAVFDVVVNNADRKGGHVLPMADGHRYGVDHGVTFHVEHKLRTVLWGWVGRAAAPTTRSPGVRRGSPTALDGELGDAARRPPDRRASSTPRPPGGSRGCCDRGRVPGAAAASYPAIPWPPF